MSKKSDNSNLRKPDDITNDLKRIEFYYDSWVKAAPTRLEKNYVQSKANSELTVNQYVLFLEMIVEKLFQMLEEE